jgi:leucyl aminopeptidase
MRLWLLSQSGLEQFLAGEGAAWRDWLQATGFRAERGQLQALPAIGGSGCTGHVAGLGSESVPDLWLAAGLAARLPAGRHALQAALPAAQASLFELGWQLGCYRYSAFKPGPPVAAGRAELLPLATADGRWAAAMAAAVTLGRDLVNAPANAMGPAELQQAAQTLAVRGGGTLAVIDGPALAQGYPLIEAVGRASPRAPRLLDLRFPRAGAPRVTLVGKGVCFDSGGLDIKPPAGMLLMKKDMGGAACALALAQVLRDLDAPIELRVLIPAVENAIGGAAFRPGDILRSRRGNSVEIGNTDAEGRLVLADALAEASAEQPDLLIDLATLTGAARVALGPDIPAIFGGDEQLLADLQRHGRENADPLWALPLWEGYASDLDSPVADLNNVASHAFAGAIIGALFLKRFVADPKRWIHVDLYAWNPRDRPGRPQGGEAQAIRALHALIRARFG